MGNRWLLYDSGAYQDVFELTGRYYFPIPFGQEETAFGTADSGRLRKVLALADEAAARFGFPDTAELSAQAARLRSILKATVPVLPPDAICVDYDILPLMLTKGCMHNCRFCAVKTSGELERLSLNEFQQQVKEAAEWVGKDSTNCTGIYLGQNDALAAGIETLAQAARATRAYCRTERLFLFGSPDSLMACYKEAGNMDRLIAEMEAVPFEEIYLNIGLESFDQKALELLGKPIAASSIEDAFLLGTELARQTRNWNVSFNFVLSKRFSKRHEEKLYDMISHHFIKAAACQRINVFISAMLGERWRLGELRRKVFWLKSASKLPLYCYVIVPYL
jgi:radical SAM superfamily enzyme YgiQ (UPF0313 family)